MAHRRELDVSRLRTFFSYGRVSTQKQKDRGGSLDTQDGKFLALEERGYQRIGVYADAKSGFTIDKRPGFRRMLDDIKTTKPDFVAVAAVDRFSRNLLNSLMLMEEFHKLGVVLYVCEDREFKDMGDPSVWSEFVDAAKFAQKERMKIAGRVQDAYDRRRDRGGDVLIGNRVPYGLIRGGDRDHPVAVPDETPLLPGSDLTPAGIVRESVRRIVAGAGLMETFEWAQTVTAGTARPLTAYNHWSALLRHRRMVLAGLISAHEADVLEGRFRANSGKRKRKYVHPMTQVVACSSCVELGIPREKALLTGGYHGSLVCPRSAVKQGGSGLHPSLSIKEEYIELRFGQLIETFVADPEFIERYEAAKQSSPIAETARHLSGQIKALDARAADFKAVRSKAFKYLDTDLDAQAREMLAEVEQGERLIKAERMRVEAEMSALRQRPETIEGVSLRTKLLQVQAMWFDPRLPAEIKNELARAICAAVGSHPVVHRMGHAKFADYGLSWEDVAVGLVAFPHAAEPTNLELQVARCRANHEVMMARRWNRPLPTVRSDQPTRADLEELALVEKARAGAFVSEQDIKSPALSGDIKCETVKWVNPFVEYLAAIAPPPRKQRSDKGQTRVAA